MQSYNLSVNSSPKPNVSLPSRSPSVPSGFENEFKDSEISKLANIKGAVDILLERARQSLASCKNPNMICESATFLKKRAIAEEEYSRNLQRAAQAAIKSLEKTSGRVDSEWEKYLLKKADKLSTNQKSTSKPKSVGNSMSTLFRQNKSLKPEAIDRLEQEARVKAKIADEMYKSHLEETNTVRDNYFNSQLPKILLTTRMFVEEIDNALKWHLGKYSYAYECTILSDALTIKPNDKPGLMDVVSNIDNSSDLKNFLDTWTNPDYTVQKDPIAYSEYRMSSDAHYLANRRQIFGVPLIDQLTRDGDEIPPILVKCVEVVESFGLQNEGVYRISGQSSVIQKLKTEFDFDSHAVDLKENGFFGDINNVTGVLKLYFRELPEKLIPKGYFEKLSNILIFGPTLVYNGESNTNADLFRSQGRILDFMLKNVQQLFFIKELNHHNIACSNKYYFGENILNKTPDDNSNSQESGFSSMTSSTEPESDQSLSEIERRLTSTSINDDSESKYKTGSFIATYRKPSDDTSFTHDSNSLKLRKKSDESIVKNSPGYDDADHNLHSQTLTEKKILDKAEDIEDHHLLLKKLSKDSVPDSQENESSPKTKAMSPVYLENFDSNRK
ncbi:hypothetical protein BB560_000743 [Smittium megazygosporum]|uniref:Rho-GAP domain-containing protein n=1 Tax=Smittium megazygosporum TaxID=133381 RepID=A0A2T9ZJH4_9FUNG|nr:hypothetical protein BB560_000743 [Smittium megazygosporum]